jgi:hypothetical protein
MKILKPAFFLSGIMALLGSLAFAGAGEGSLTPTSFKIPILKVSIAKSDDTEEQSLYECPAATIAGCMVDVTDTTALDAITALASEKSIREGTYHKLNIFTCPTGSTGSDTTVVKATGSVVINGTTYYTETAGSNGVSSALTSAEETEIDTLGCATVSVTPATPITVTAGASQTLTLTVNLSNILYTTPNTSPGQGGCKAPAGGGQRGLCTNFPFVIPYLGTGTVTTEKYYIANSSTNNASSLAVTDANGQVLLAVDPDGKVFYVSTLPYFSHTSPATSSGTNGGNSMLYAISRVDQNDPSLGLEFSYDSTANTVSFLTGGSLDLNGFGVDGFQRVTHTGVTKPRTGGTAWYYKAFKQ